MIFDSLLKIDYFPLDFFRLKEGIRVGTKLHIFHTQNFVLMPPEINQNIKKNQIEVHHFLLKFNKCY